MDLGTHNLFVPVAFNMHAQECVIPMLIMRERARQQKRHMRMDEPASQTQMNLCLNGNY